MKWKQGDLLPVLLHTMEDEAGAFIDLNAATSVFFQWRLAERGSEVFEQEAEILDEDTGEVAYEFQAGETDVAGQYQGQFVATFPGGEQTSPVSGFIDFSIEEDL